MIHDTALFIDFTVNGLYVVSPVMFFINNNSEELVICSRLGTVFPRYRGSKSRGEVFPSEKDRVVGFLKV